MKILITGAEGFLGSHLTERLASLNHKVKAFIMYNFQNSLGYLEGCEPKLMKNIEIFQGDVRDNYCIRSAMKGCDAVINLAALIGIPYSYASPLAYIRTNVEGTYNVLESAKNLELDQVLITSTSETYGTAQYVPIDENHPLVGQSPYSASKIAADQLAISYCRSFGLPVKIVRPFNTYGPRQSSRAIIPTVISQLLSGKNQIQLGSLTPTRDLTYVLDTCQGFLNIYNSDSLFGEATNIGMKSEISINDLSNLIAKLYDAKISIKSSNKRIRPDNSEVERLVCDNSKLIKHTSWKPKYNLEEGIKKVIEWMKKPQNFNMYKSEQSNV